MTDDQEYSESGAPIFRHKARETPFELATSDVGSIEHMDRHIEEHIGPVATVLHEILSDLVHVDLHVVEPTPTRNFYSLFKLKMGSDLLFDRF